MALFTIAPAAIAGVNTASTVHLELRAAATERLFIKEIGIFVVTAPTTAPLFALARPSNTPAGGTTLGTIQKMDPADAAATASCFGTTWTTTPTLAAPYLKLAGLPATAGTGLIWTFPDPLVVPLSGSLIIANLNAAGASLGSFGFYLTWAE